MSIVLKSDGSSWRDPRSEEEVRSWLKEVDPLLDIRWFDTPVRSSRGRHAEGRYAILCRWPEADSRWEMYRSGEIGDCHDILGWCVEPDGETGLQSADGKPVNPDTIRERIAHWLGRMDCTREPWRKRMQRTVENNERLRKQRIAEVVDATMDEVETRHRMRRQVGRYSNPKS